FSVVIFSSRRRHTRFSRDWSSDVCSSDLRHSPLSNYSLLDRYPVMDASFAPHIPITLPPGGTLKARVAVGVMWYEVNLDTPEEEFPTQLQIQTFALYATGWSL